MMRKLYSHFMHHLIPLMISGFCFASMALYGHDHHSNKGHRQSHRHANERHHGKSNNECNASPVQVNPTNDLVLDYSQIAIEDLYSPFFNPSSPTSLSNVTGQYNTYSSPVLAANPANKKNLITLFAQDEFAQVSAPLVFSGVSNAGATLAYSTNGGKTWKPSLAALPTWLDKTGLSQTVTASNVTFSNNGTAFILGNFSSTNTTDPYAGTGGIFVTRSRDGGATWSKPIVLDTLNSSAFFIGIGKGFIITAGGLLADSVRKNFVHATWSNIDDTRDTLYGDIWYSRSTNNGKKWEEPRLIYDVAQDPLWVSQYGYQNLSVTPPIYLGGQTISAGNCLVEVPVSEKRGHQKDKDSVLINGMVRLYPKQGVPVFDDTPATSLFDHAVVRSFDGGTSWTQEAVSLGQFSFAFSHNPTIPGVFNLLVVDGALNSELAVSPKTGRVYFAWQGGNTAVSTDPTVNQFFPVIQLAASDNAGKTWSSTVNVSRTPFNSTITSANQSFNVNIAVTTNGYLGVIYSDFRNYDGSSTVASANNWLAIYRETRDSKGGSTGIGLDFVKEIQLGPTFDALIGFNSILPTIGASNGIVAQGKNFLTAFDITNQGNLVPILGGGPDGMTQDLNNRINVFFQKICPSKKRK